MSRRPFSGRTVLVTGHTGFKGSWLSLWLHDLGAHVVGYALAPNTRPSLFKALKLDSLIDSHLGDIRDQRRLSALMRRTRPQIVFHLAAQPLVRRSYEEPSQTFSVNLQGTVNLLEAVRQTSSVRVCQVITTDKCYENPDGRSHREEDRLGGRDPYSASKACAELAVASYRNSFFPQGVSLSSVRAGNVIGGGDWAQDRLLPDCMRALCRHKPLLLRNPRSVRPWQHVLDPLAGYLRLAAKQWARPQAFAEAWNFGPSSSASFTTAQIAQACVTAWGQGTWRQAPGKHPHESAALRLNSTKARRRLSWRPALNTLEAVLLSVQWYKGYYLDPSFDALSCTRSQIQAYEARLP